ncbi:hypothetical protein [Streptomyces sp. Isolate_45]|uniref:hypothetical protein n=1 Tax=unclassified Streptomyces TaxID=2593676 RepID=UPI002481DEEE|nr:hypothetical protein [Streptomyces sp. Isolate_45]MDA5284718.1 hypothetical protein [Streptomyces sp. Isolate_45]
MNMLGPLLALEPAHGPAATRAVAAPLPAGRLMCSADVRESLTTRDVMCALPRRNAALMIEC